MPSLPQAQPLNQWFPDLVAPCQSVYGPIRDYRAQLLPGEQAAVARAVPNRQHEFASGRLFARLAMGALGVRDQPVLAGAHREPLWPAEIVGAISHSKGEAWAAVARRDQGVQGVGIDLEHLGRLQPQLYERLFTAAECRHIEREGPALATSLFSAKEAVYKAVFPHGQRFIGFQEVELILDLGGGTDARPFRARYLGSHEPNRIMEAGLGHVRLCDPLVFTVFVLAG
ncbi:MAG: 4'-phosphopantetheinyl transferase superfamily protein [Pseudomonadota bacterium]